MLMRLIQREIYQRFYHRLALLNALLFFVIIVCLFPLSISADSNLLNSIGPGVIWVGAILSILLSSQSLFMEDFEDGSLDQMLMLNTSLSNYVVAKLLVYWISLLLPLLLTAAVLAVLYHLSIHRVYLLSLGLLFATPTLILISATMASLTLKIKKNKLLSLLITLPIYIPILILATLSTSTTFLLLLAMLLIALVCLPVLVAYLLRQACYLE